MVKTIWGKIVEKRGLFVQGYFHKCPVS